MKKLLYAWLPCFLLLIGGCMAPRQMVYDGPLLVPAEEKISGIPDDVQFADYWTRIAGNPDEIILKPEDIEAFNENNPVKKTDIIDITEFPGEIDGITFREHIAANARYLIQAGLYVTGDIPLEMADRHRIATLMDSSDVPDVISVEYGVMLRREMGKSWPTAIPLTSEPGDTEFDPAVISSIDMGEPVALLHTSQDGLWSYIQTYGFTCWVHSDAVAFGDIRMVKELTDKTAPVVATGHRVSVYGTPGGGAAVGAIQMGSYLPIRMAGKDYLEVLMPGRDDTNRLVAKRGYVRNTSNVSIGFLPYTLRNVHRQCFVLFGRRYGWGGMFEERDCSAFAQDVFKCFGFRLPRNSSKLLQASPCVVDVEKYDRATRLELLKTVPGGISLIGWPGHIMIYLGSIQGTPYVIHDFYGWRTPTFEGGPDVTHRNARIAVSDLLLGDGSKRGSFLDRMRYITILGNYSITSE